MDTDIYELETDRRPLGGPDGLPPPDFYRQTASQPENVMTSNNVVHGYRQPLGDNLRNVTWALGNLAQDSSIEDIVLNLASSFNTILQKRGTESQLAMPRLQDVRTVLVQESRSTAFDPFFSELSSSANPYSALFRHPFPLYRLASEMLEKLKSKNVPSIRAAWAIKTSLAIYKRQKSSTYSQKVQEWTKCLAESVGAHFEDVLHPPKQDDESGKQPRVDPSKKYAAVRAWLGQMHVATILHNEGCLSPKGWLSFLISMVAVTDKEETARRAVLHLPFLISSLDEILACRTLSIQLIEHCLSSLSALDAIPEDQITDYGRDLKATFGTLVARALSKSCHIAIQRKGIFPKLTQENVASNFPPSYQTLAARFSARPLASVVEMYASSVDQDTRLVPALVSRNVTQREAKDAHNSLRGILDRQLFLSSHARRDTVDASHVVVVYARLAAFIDGQQLSAEEQWRAQKHRNEESKAGRAGASARHRKHVEKDPSRDVPFSGAEPAPMERLYSLTFEPDACIASNVSAHRPPSSTGQTNAARSTRSPPPSTPAPIKREILVQHDRAATLLACLLFLVSHAKGTPDVVGHVVAKLFVKHAQADPSSRRLIQGIVHDFVLSRDFAKDKCSGLTFRIVTFLDVLAKNDLFRSHELVLSVVALPVNQQDTKWMCCLDYLAHLHSSCRHSLKLLERRLAAVDASSSTMCRASAVQAHGMCVAMARALNALPCPSTQRLIAFCPDLQHHEDQLRAHLAAIQGFEALSFVTETVDVVDEPLDGKTSSTASRRRSSISRTRASSKPPDVESITLDMGQVLLSDRHSVGDWLLQIASRLFFVPPREDTNDHAEARDIPDKTPVCLMSRAQFSQFINFLSELGLHQHIVDLCCTVLSSIFDVANLLPVMMPHLIQLHTVLACNSETLLWVFESLRHLQKSLVQTGSQSAYLAVEVRSVLLALLHMYPFLAASAPELAGQHSGAGKLYSPFNPASSASPRPLPSASPRADTPGSLQSPSPNSAAPSAASQPMSGASPAPSNASNAGATSDATGAAVETLDANEVDILLADPDSVNEVKLASLARSDESTRQFLQKSVDILFGVDETKRDRLDSDYSNKLIRLTCSLAMRSIQGSTHIEVILKKRLTQLPRASALPSDPTVPAESLSQLLVTLVRDGVFSPEVLIARLIDTQRVLHVMEGRQTQDKRGVLHALTCFATTRKLLFCDGSSQGGLAANASAQSGDSSGAGKLPSTASLATAPLCSRGFSANALRSSISNRDLAKLAVILARLHACTGDGDLRVIAMLLARCSARRDTLENAIRDPTIPNARRFAVTSYLRVLRGALAWLLHTHFCTVHLDSVAEDALHLRGDNRDTMFQDLLRAAPKPAAWPLVVLLVTITIEDTKDKAAYFDALAQAVWSQLSASDCCLTLWAGEDQPLGSPLLGSETYLAQPHGDSDADTDDRGHPPFASVLCPTFHLLHHQRVGGLSPDITLEQIIGAVELAPLRYLIDSIADLRPRLLQRLSKGLLQKDKWWFERSPVYFASSGGGDEQASATPKKGSSASFNATLSGLIAVSSSEETVISQCQRFISCLHYLVFPKNPTGEDSVVSGHEMVASLSFSSQAAGPAGVVVNGGAGTSAANKFSNYGIKPETYAGLAQDLRMQLKNCLDELEAELSKTGDDTEPDVKERLQRAHNALGLRLRALVILLPYIFQQQNKSVTVKAVAGLFCQLLWTAYQLDRAVLGLSEDWADQPTFSLHLAFYDMFSLIVDDLPEEDASKFTSSLLEPTKLFCQLPAHLQQMARALHPSLALHKSLGPDLSLKAPAADHAPSEGDIPLQYLVPGRTPPHPLHWSQLEAVRVQRHGETLGLACLQARARAQSPTKRPSSQQGPDAKRSKPNS